MITCLLRRNAMERMMNMLKGTDVCGCAAREFIDAPAEAAQQAYRPFAGATGDGGG